MIDPISLATVITALIPVATYGLKRIIDYKTGGMTPANNTEATEAKKADALILDAVYRNDIYEGASQWVINIRALQRPIVVFMVLFTWCSITIGSLFGYYVDLQLYVIVANLASSVWFYLFGDRTLLYGSQILNTKLLSKK